MVKIPGTTSKGSNVEEKVRTVSMTEEEFEEFLKHKAFKQEKIQNKLKKKALIKRLRRRNLDLERGTVSRGKFGSPTLQRKRMIMTRRLRWKWTTTILTMS